MIRVSISGILSLNNAHLAAHSLNVYNLPNVADVDDEIAHLMWRYSFASPGRFNLNFTASFTNCNHTLLEVVTTGPSLATEGYDKPIFCDSVPHGGTTLRVTSYVIRGSNTAAHQRCTQPVAISDLSDGWWQSSDGREVAQSGRLRWHLRRCTQWQDVLDVEVREALSWWARAGKSTLYLVGDSNSGKVSKAANAPAKNRSMA